MASGATPPALPDAAEARVNVTLAAIASDLRRALPPGTAYDSGVGVGGVSSTFASSGSSSGSGAGAGSMTVVSFSSMDASSAAVGGIAGSSIAGATSIGSDGGWMVLRFRLLCGAPSAASISAAGPGSGSGSSPASGTWAGPVCLSAVPPTPVLRLAAQAAGDVYLGWEAGFLSSTSWSSKAAMLRPWWEAPASASSAASTPATSGSSGSGSALAAATDGAAAAALASLQVQRIQAAAGSPSGLFRITTAALAVPSDGSRSSSPASVSFVATAAAATRELAFPLAPQLQTMGLAMQSALASGGRFVVNASVEAAGVVVVDPILSVAQMQALQAAMPRQAASLTVLAPAEQLLALAAASPAGSTGIAPVTAAVAAAMTAQNILPPRRGAVSVAVLNTLAPANSTAARRVTPTRLLLSDSLPPAAAALTLSELPAEGETVRVACFLSLAAAMTGATSLSPAAAAAAGEALTLSLYQVSSTDLAARIAAGATSDFLIGASLLAAGPAAPGAGAPEGSPAAAAVSTAAVTASLDRASAQRLGRSIVAVVSSRLLPAALAAAARVLPSQLQCVVNSTFGAPPSSTGSSAAAPSPTPLPLPLYSAVAPLAIDALLLPTEWTFFSDALVEVLPLASTSSSSSLSSSLSSSFSAPAVRSAWSTARTPVTSLLQAVADAAAALHAAAVAAAAAAASNATNASVSSSAASPSPAPFVPLFGANGSVPLSVSLPPSAALAAYYSLPDDVAAAALLALVALPPPNDAPFLLPLGTPVNVTFVADAGAGSGGQRPVLSRFRPGTSVTVNGVPCPVRWISSDGRALRATLPSAEAACAAIGADATSSSCGYAIVRLRPPSMSLGALLRLSLGGTAAAPVQLRLAAGASGLAAPVDCSPFCPGATGALPFTVSPRRLATSAPSPSPSPSVLPSPTPAGPVGARALVLQSPALSLRSLQALSEVQEADALAAIVEEEVAAAVAEARGGSGAFFESMALTAAYSNGGRPATVGLAYAAGCTAPQFAEAAASGACLNASDPLSARCGFGSGSSCVPCPTVGGRLAALCPAGRAWPLPGYWSAGEQSTTVLACPRPASARCLGWNATMGAVQCGAGYLQGSPLCSACAPGYHADAASGACVRCPADIRTATIIDAAAFTGGVAGVAAVVAAAAAGIAVWRKGRPGPAAFRGLTVLGHAYLALAPLVTLTRLIDPAGLPTVFSRWRAAVALLQFVGVIPPQTCALDVATPASSPASSMVSTAASSSAAAAASAAFPASSDAFAYGWAAMRAPFLQLGTVAAALALLLLLHIPIALHALAVACCCRRPGGGLPSSAASGATRGQLTQGGIGGAAGPKGSTVPPHMHALLAGYKSSGALRQSSLTLANMGGSGAGGSAAAAGLRAAAAAAAAQRAAAAGGSGGRSGTGGVGAAGMSAAQLQQLQQQLRSIASGSAGASTPTSRKGAPPPPRHTGCCGRIAACCTSLRRVVSAGALAVSVLLIAILALLLPSVTNSAALAFRCSPVIATAREYVILPGADGASLAALPALPAATMAQLLAGSTTAAGAAPSDSYVSAFAAASAVPVPVSTFVSIFTPSKASGMTNELAVLRGCVASPLTPGCSAAAVTVTLDAPLAYSLLEGDGSGTGSGGDGAVVCYEGAHRTLAQASLATLAVYSVAAAIILTAVGLALLTSSVTEAHPDILEAREALVRRRLARARAAALVRTRACGCCCGRGAAPAATTASAASTAPAPQDSEGDGVDDGSGAAVSSTAIVPVPASLSVSAQAQALVAASVAVRRETAAADGEAARIETRLTQLVAAAQPRSWPLLSASGAQVRAAPLLLALQAACILALALVLGLWRLPSAPPADAPSTGGAIAVLAVVSLAPIIAAAAARSLALRPAFAFAVAQALTGIAAASLVALWAARYMAFSPGTPLPAPWPVPVTAPPLWLDGLAYAAIAATAAAGGAYLLAALASAASGAKGDAMRRPLPQVLADARVSIGVEGKAGDPAAAAALQEMQAEADAAADGGSAAAKERRGSLPPRVALLTNPLALARWAGIVPAPAPEPEPSPQASPEATPGPAPSPGDPAAEAGAIPGAVPGDGSAAGVGAASAAGLSANPLHRRSVRGGAAARGGFRGGRGGASASALAGFRGPGSGPGAGQRIPPPPGHALAPRRGSAASETGSGSAAGDVDADVDVDADATLTPTSDSMLADAGGGDPWSVLRVKLRRNGDGNISDADGDGEDDDDSGTGTPSATSSSSSAAISRGRLGAGARGSRVNPNPAFGAGQGRGSFTQNLPDSPTAAPTSPGSAVAVSVAVEEEPPADPVVRERWAAARGLLGSSSAFTSSAMSSTSARNPAAAASSRGNPAFASTSASTSRSKGKAKGRGPSPGPASARSPEETAAALSARLALAKRALPFAPRLRRPVSPTHATTRQGGPGAAAAAAEAAAAAAAAFSARTLGAGGTRSPSPGVGVGAGGRLSPRLAMGASDDERDEHDDRGDHDRSFDLDGDGDDDDRSVASHDGDHDDALAATSNRIRGTALGRPRPASANANANANVASTRAVGRAPALPGRLAAAPTPAAVSVGLHRVAPPDPLSLMRIHRPTVVVAPRGAATAGTGAGLGALSGGNGRPPRVAPVLALPRGAAARTANAAAIGLPVRPPPSRPLGGPYGRSLGLSDDEDDHGHDDEDDDDAGSGIVSLDRRSGSLIGELVNDGDDDDDSVTAAARQRAISPASLAQPQIKTHGGEFDRDDDDDDDDDFRHDHHHDGEGSGSDNGPAARAGRAPGPGRFGRPLPAPAPLPVPGIAMRPAGARVAISNAAPAVGPAAARAAADARIRAASGRAGAAGAASAPMPRGSMAARFASALTPLASLPSAAASGTAAGSAGPSVAPAAPVAAVPSLRIARRPPVASVAATALRRAGAGAGAPSAPPAGP